MSDFPLGTPTEVLPPPPPAEAVGQNGGTDPAVSILSGLRKEHAQVRAARTEVFVIPGYEDRPTPLACRYGVIPFPVQSRLQTALAEAPADDDNRLMNFMLDQLIQACREIGVMADGKFQPLDPSRPVTWGSDRLLHGLGITLDSPTPSARERLLAVFVAEHGEEDGPYALDGHHTDVMAWMMPGKGQVGAASEADQEFAGKS